jgi:DNA-binding GntR family transcriptional regulator
MRQEPPSSPKHEGAVNTEFSAEEVDDALTWRRVVEMGVAEVAAAQNLSADQRGQLAAAIRREP